MKRSGLVTVLVVALLAGLFGFAIVSYFVSERSPANRAAQSQTTTATQTAAPQTGQTAPNSNTQNNTQQPPIEDDGSFMSQVFGGEQPLPGGQRVEDWRIIIPRILVRLTLAAMLAGMLAFRPRKVSIGRQRNLFVAQTQILLAVVASALMMIVGDNAARAFGIFAAVSLVRFRTNIRDPKEITVLLISLSLGLATGVGRWDLAIILALFVLPLLWFLESKEHEQVFRSMELTVKTYNTELMQQTLKQVFRRHRLNTELRQIDPPDEEDPMGCIMYSVSMSLSASTDQISDEIRAANPQNVDSIEWDQKKTDSSYIFQ